MAHTDSNDLLRHIPSMTDLLAGAAARGWLDDVPRSLLTDVLRETVEELRRQILADDAGRCGGRHVTGERILDLAGERLRARTRPHLHGAVNATGIILHTGLGRAVWPESVVASMTDELSGYVTLAIDPETGARLDRDRQIEYILTELTGAEAATVVNNNAAATMLVLAALAAEREVIVSRGQLIEIGGSFRLPEVMAQSRARLVEVGATNRTHLRDYAAAVTGETAAIMRVHPSNFRVVGFTAEVPLAEMTQLARERGVLCIDDLGAGALVDLEPFGLPHEPTARESIAAGADIVLFSADKLIGASQGGIIIGKRPLIDRIRAHPLARALRVDKSCLMALERTLYLFRDPARLAERHPTYRMLAATPETLRLRAETLATALKAAVPAAWLGVQQDVSYLGSGSLPAQALSTWVVTVALPEVKTAELARRLRAGEPAVVARVSDDRVLLDMRTVAETDLPRIVTALERAGHE